MKRIFTIAMLLICSSALAQETTKTKEELKSVKDLAFMIGKWEGSGWMMIKRERKNFIQSETIQTRLDSTILVVDGIGYAMQDNKPTTEVIHNAFGVISYDTESKKIKMLSYSTTGGKMENDFKMIGERKLQWSFKDERGGTIRFTEDYSKQDKWIQKGEYSFDGKKWFPFFEMRLNRIG